MADVVLGAPARRGAGLRVAARYAAVGALVLAVASVHLRSRPATLCLLRGVTGIPCPFCGGTTAAVHLGTGDLVGALRASPLALLMLAGWPLLGIVRPAVLRSRRLRWSAVLVVLATAEVWQLVRFGIIGG